MISKKVQKIKEKIKFLFYSSVLGWAWRIYLILPRVVR